MNIFDHNNHFVGQRFDRDGYIVESDLSDDGESEDVSVYDINECFADLNSDAALIDVDESGSVTPVELTGDDVYDINVRVSECADDSLQSDHVSLIDVDTNNDYEIVIDYDGNEIVSSEPDDDVSVTICDYDGYVPESDGDVSGMDYDEDRFGGYDLTDFDLSSQ